jgi:hypothetical protein
MKKEILKQIGSKLLSVKVSKPVLILFALTFFSIGASASPHLATKQQIGMFKNSRTCIVLESGISSYNSCMKDAIQKYWKSTEFEFIDQQQFESRKRDSKYSFIVLMKAVYDKDPGGVSYNYISLVLGDPAYDMTDMPEFCSIPISYTDDNNDFEFAIPAIVKFMQKHVRKLEKSRFQISLNGLKYYNGGQGFKDKVLLLNKDFMASDADTPEKINTVYPYYVKLLTTLEIQAELLTNPVNTLFNFHVGPAENTGAGKCFEMIFDEEGNLYYYNFRMITNDNEDGFNLQDFHNIM